MEWYRADRAGQAARADAAQRPQGVVSGRRAPCLFACTAALVILCWSQNSSSGSRWRCSRTAPSAPFFRGLATHELNHKTVFRTKWLKQAVPVRIRAAELGTTRSITP